MTLLTQPVTDIEHAWGALDAPIVIVEYGDYCGGSANKPFCDGTHTRIDFRSS